MRNEKFEDWQVKLNEVFAKNFEENSQLENLIKQGSIIGSSIRELQKDSLLESLEKNVHEAIKDELIRYRDFMSKKLITMTKVNKRIEGDRDEIFLKIQNENTNLIIECNRLRKEKHLIKNKWKTLQKNLKEITRELTGMTEESLDLNEEEVEIDEQKFLIEQTMSEQRIVVKKNKEELPFVKYVNEKKAKLANNSASKEVISPLKLLEKQPTNHKLFNILINEIEKHNLETVNQGTLIEKLRDKVHQFLYLEDPNLSNTNINTSTLPAIRENDTLMINELGGKSSFHELSKKNLGSPIPSAIDKGLKISGLNILGTTPLKKL